MSLRRTALVRKTELRRTPLARGRGLRARSVKAARPRDTGPASPTRRLVLYRAAGCCEVCGRQLHDGDKWGQVHSFHHRQPRGMGGTSRAEANSPSNLLLVCGTGTTGCHGLIEDSRRYAVGEGWLVPRGDDPAETPCTVYAGPAHWQGVAATRVVLLTPAGGYQEVAA